MTTLSTEEIDRIASQVGLRPEQRQELHKELREALGGVNVTTADAVRAVADKKRAGRTVLSPISAAEIDGRNIALLHQAKALCRQLGYQLDLQSDAPLDFVERRSRISRGHAR